MRSSHRYKANPLHILSQSLKWLLALPGSRTRESYIFHWFIVNKEGLLSNCYFSLRQQLNQTKLIDYDPEDRKPVSDFPLSILPQALPTINCFQALDYLYIYYSI